MRKFIRETILIWKMLRDWSNLMGSQKTVIANQIYALDEKSFDDMVKRNAESIIRIMHRSVRAGGTFRKHF